MIKIPVVNKQDYTMYLELYHNMLWFHTDVHKWSVEIKKKYMQDLDVLQNLVNVPLAALVDVEDIKLAKFGKSTGWIKINSLTANNKRYDVYTRSKTWVT